MSYPSRTILLGLAALAVGAWASADPPRLSRRSTIGVTAVGGKTEGRDADRAAIEKSSRDFSAAFAKGDAKACAAFWTAEGEFHDDNGSVRSRVEIEKLFRQHFKEAPKGKVDVVIESIRFPARDLAVEEGLLRHETTGKDLPSSTRYSVLHVREGGQWKIAMAREWGAGQDRLEDIEWLIGAWSAKVKDQEVVLTFERDKAKPFITGHFTKKVGGKTAASGTMKIGLDPQSGQLHSWHFEDDGGHGQARWVRDAHNWLLDAAGVTADGINTAGVNIIARLGQHEFTWRSIERSLGGVTLPDTPPIKLERVRESK